MIPLYYVAHSPDPRPVLTFKKVSQFSPGQGHASSSSPCEDDKDDAGRGFAAAANDHRNMNMPFYTRPATWRTLGIALGQARLLWDERVV